MSVQKIEIDDHQQLLKLKYEKTEPIVITTHSKTSQNKHIAINTRDDLITPSREPTSDIGVLFDLTCSLNNHAP